MVNLCRMRILIGLERRLKFDRLKKLSAEIVLTTEGQAEAEKLVSELSAKYGDLGITVDKTAVRISALNAEAARISAGTRHASRTTAHVFTP